MLWIRYGARIALNEALVLKIDPRTVAHHVGTNQPLTFPVKRRLLDLQSRFTVAHKPIKYAHKILYSIEPFRVSPSVFFDMKPVEVEPRYRLIEDFLRNRDDVTASNWYAVLVGALAQKGCAWHKNIALPDESAVKEFLNGYVLNMVRSMETHGYDDRLGADIGTAFIDRNGRICKSDAGNHRFSIARLLGVPEFPLEIIGVHRDWFHDVAPMGEVDDLLAGLKQVERAHQFWEEDGSRISAVS